jgi:hypothetical protein
MTSMVKLLSRDGVSMATRSRLAGLVSCSFQVKQCATWHATPVGTPWVVTRSAT